MKATTLVQPLLALAAGAGLLFLPGCVQPPERPAWRYLQKAPVRVAILPAGNRTAQVGAPLIIDKAWEEQLRRAGFVVVNADSVITYLSSRSVPVAKLPTVPAAQLGQDLRVDYLLRDEIVDWGVKYHVIESGAVVSCQSWLIEAKTGATVWASGWTMREQNNSNGNNGIGGMLASALVSAVVNSMVDEPTQLARQGVMVQADRQPYPGFAPARVPGS